MALTLQHFLYFKLGIISLTITLLGAIIASPLLLYRYLIQNVFPRPPNISKFLSPTSQILSFDLLSSPKSRDSSTSYGNRSTIVITQYFPKSVTPEKVKSAIFSGLLDKQNEDGSLKYPEFREYCDEWMGYSVLCKDYQFDIDNHFIVHSLNENNEKTSERFLEDLVETSVNKRFDRNKSPWEFHVVTNFKGAHTVVILRIHHCLADGFSLVKAALEGLYGHTVQKYENSTEVKEKPSKSDTSKILYSAVRLFYDIGQLTAQTLFPNDKIPSFCPDKIKSGYQLYAKSNHIQVARIKVIKDKLGVSFTTIVLACISNAVTNYLKTRKTENVKSFSMGIPVPLPGHPKTLDNHMTLVLIEIPCDPRSQSLERVEKIKSAFLDARHNSQFPLIIRGLMLLAGSWPSFIGKHLPNNESVSVGLTSFPGPSEPMFLHEEICENVEFCVGGQAGNCGVVISFLTYNGSSRFTVTAESAVMSRPELAEFINSLESEINYLFSCCTEVKDKKLE